MSLNGMGRGASRARQNSDNSGTENILFSVKGYQIADEKKRQATPDKDTMTIALWHDAFGLTATFDEAGNPTTELTLRLGKFENTGKNARPEVFEMLKGKAPLGAAMPIDSVMIAERAYKNRDGEVVAHWLRRVHPNYNPDLHFPQAGVLAMTRPEYSFERDGVKTYGQSTEVLYVHGAVQVADLTSFREAAIAVVADHAAQEFPGAAGFQLRLAELNGDSATIESVFPKWLAEQERPQTPEEMVDAWLADANEVVVALRSVLDGTIEAPALAPGKVLMEVIPTSRINIVGASLPSNRFADALQAGKVEDTPAARARFTDSTYFAYKDPENPGSKYDPVGYAVSIVRAERKHDAETGYGRYYNTGTRPVKNFGPIYKQGEVITPNTPADLAAKFEQRAIARNARQPRADQAKAADPAPAQEQEPSQQYGM